MAKQTLFRYITDEESQNDFFSSLLAFSLDHGPEVLNAIHEDLNFSPEAAVVATQRQGLPRHPPDAGSKYTLDWVVQDSDKLVGYESKTGGSEPSDGQLNGELAKLQANSGGREVFLYAITDHHKSPINRPDVRWTSWHDVAAGVQALEPTNDSIKILQEMFENEGYERFSGFDSFEQSREWFLNHERQIVRLAFEISSRSEDVELYTQGRNHVPQHTDTKQLTKVFKYGSHGLNQSVYALSYHPVDTPKYARKGYNICLLAPAIENRMGVYMHLKASRDRVEEFVRDSVAELASIAEEHDMTLRSSYNRLNDPEREIKEYTDPSEMERVLRDNAGSKYWKRLYFGWEIDIEQPARDIVAECSERTATLYDLFFDSPSRLEGAPQY